MGNKKVFRTYENIFLDTLREIEPASMRQMAKALNMKHPPYSIIRSLLKKELIVKNEWSNPNTFTVKEVILRER